MYKYKNAINIIICKFDDVRVKYEQNKEDYEDLPYVFYENLFLKYIIDILNKNEADKLFEIFNLLEKLLDDGDEEIINLVEVSIIESLFFDVTINHKSAMVQYFGKKSKESYYKCKPNILD